MSPSTSLHLPISPHISPYLPRAPLCRGRLRLISGATAEGLHLLRKCEPAARRQDGDAVRRGPRAAAALDAQQELGARVAAG